MGIPPKWMVKIMENPIFLMDDLEGKTPYFWGYTHLLSEFDSTGGHDAFAQRQADQILVQGVWPHIASNLLEPGHA